MVNNRGPTVLLVTPWMSDRSGRPGRRIRASSTILSSRIKDQLEVSSVIRNTTVTARIWLNSWSILRPGVGRDISPLSRTKTISTSNHRGILANANLIERYRCSSASHEIIATAYCPRHVDKDEKQVNRAASVIPSTTTGKVNKSRPSVLARTLCTVLPAGEFIPGLTLSLGRSSSLVVPAFLRTT